MMAIIMEGTTVVDTDADNNADPATGESVYTAMDTDGVNITLSLMGPDAAKFSLSSGNFLSFVMKPDYENPTDANGNNVYEVTVRASDGTMYADRMVKITVINVDEAPVIMRGENDEESLSISGPSFRNYAENGIGAVATYVLSGSNKDRASWSLTGDDRGGLHHQQRRDAPLPQFP